MEKGGREEQEKMEEIKKSRKRTRWNRGKITLKERERKRRKERRSCRNMLMKRTRVTNAEV
jgi:hypothetical protein